MPDTVNAVPKKLWMMWLQGLDSAPPVVKAYYRSWQELHPDWEFVFLDETNFRDYVDVEPVLAQQPHLEGPARSDLIRINLLARHGADGDMAPLGSRMPGPLHRFPTDVTPL